MEILKIWTENDFAFRRRFGINEIILHPVGADIALVKLSEEVNITMFPPLRIPRPGRKSLT